MRDSQIVFLGAGKANVVVDLPIADLPSAPSSLRTSAAKMQRIALRVRRAAHKECAECYRALRAYAGCRDVITLGPALYNAIEAVVPPTHRKLITGATEATVVPNFASIPAHLLRVDVTAAEARGRAVDYAVEVKPKGAWQSPQVVGIVVDGETYWVEEAKRRHCRYGQMRCYKDVRDAKKDELPATMASAPPAHTEKTSSPSLPYCPNYLFRTSLSTREGLRRLMHSPQNNLKVVRCCPSGAQSPGGDPTMTTLTVSELCGVADAIDASGVLTPLSHLQLCGCAPPAADEPADVAADKQLPVLDVALLYRWSLAKDKDAVEWIMLPGDPAAHCSCTAPDTFSRALKVDEARRVRPMLDYETCKERFYVSTTARDVSLIIAVSSRRGAPDASTACSRLTGVPADVGGVFVQRGPDVYRVGVVDLDDKKHKTLHHYYLHDREIVEAFLNQHRTSLTK
ncbi:hypothetical protein ABB37_03533 [Leptomonas pyrrhocoris]|uniref:Inositol-pentakisphosphate 2-kinase n=1 Tax=Leptomonas pyrrhocoris TaxID=157538 RepID=A0A0N0DX33_LEPPY|nr:hypothetical protein ABB37_03533 [Leptomonas pyrrhocoris]KPA82472.1 hypothetical protein ABB37_03533 [Leptomonas pyrrhocoris]|eukprot:XP_015660911.1 hypothetical protein ABB37_03533 [Leptomonas pyrrhocoris]